VSVSPLLGIGVRALAANYSSLQTIGHNISNANVAGYSRQNAELATNRGQYTSAGFIGKGVDVQSITRAHDVFLTREAAGTSSLAAMDAARAAQLKSLDAVFVGGEQGLGWATSSFLTTLGDMAARPADQATRTTVLARAQDMVQRFNEAGQNFDGAQRSVTEQLRADVLQINDLARGIAQANRNIAAAAGGGQTPNDLLDERDRLLAKLSSKIAVSTVADGSGGIGVFVAGGQRLVLGVQAEQMAVVSDASDPTRSALAMREGGVGGQPERQRLLAEQALGGGSVAGLLRFQNDDLVRARVLIGQMSASVAGAVNEQHALGMNLRNPPGSGAAMFTELARLVQTRAVPHTDNRRNGSGGFIAEPTISVTDPGRLQASEYALYTADDNGTPRWTLERLADGRKTVLQPGVEVDGLLIDLGTPPPENNERFLLQPVSNAARRLALLLSDPRDLAAALPLTASVSPANTGSASVLGLAITDPAANPQHTATLSFTSDSGDYAWTLHDRDTQAVVSSGTGRWTAGENLPAAPDIDINGFALQLSGVPRSGDVLTVERTLFPAANNGNAQALTALRDSMLVGELSGLGLSASEAFASALADMGARVQSARTAAGISQSLADSVETRRAQNAGVNLDEEAAKMIQYQQSYQAAARVLQVAQTLFDQMLQNIN